MIPKIIHYCWFGGNPKGGLIKRCIESWKKFLPDYEIMEWNEENFDVNHNQYTADAYKAKKWAFVSDYARLWAVYEYGGIYMDTDVEVLKPLDSFLENSYFTGFEANDSLYTAVFGAEKGNSHVKKMMEEYDNLSFYKEDGTVDLFTNTYRVSDYMLRTGFKPNGKEQVISGIHMYPQIVFCPNNMSRVFNIVSRKTYCIHHFDQSWRANRIEQHSFFARVRRFCVGMLRNRLGTKQLKNLKRKLLG